MPPDLVLFERPFFAVQSDTVSHLPYSGTYVMTRRERHGHFILYSGETRNLAARFERHHRLYAAERRGMTHVFFHPCQDEWERKDLEIAVRYVFDPPVNLEASPSHLRAWLAGFRLQLPELVAIAGARYQDDASMQSTTNAFAVRR